MTTLTCPICYTSTGYHKMDCPNADYVQQQRQELIDEIQFLVDGMTELQEAIIDMGSNI